ncbi:MAG: DUF1592 domain-containing protein [Myxococcaceae bacterium]
MAGLGCSGTFFTPPPETSFALSSLVHISADQYSKTVHTAFPTLSAIPELPADSEYQGFTHNRLAFANDTTVRAYSRAAEAIADEVAANPAALLSPCSVAVSGEQECVRQYVTRAGRILFRATVSAARREQVVTGVFQPVRSTETLPRALSAVTEYLLQAPEFLYVLEVAPDDLRKPGRRTYPLSDTQLSARLAQLIWDGAPDDALLAAADTGALHAPQELAVQTRRLLADPRAKALFRRFVTELLDLRRLSHSTKRADLYPMFSDALKAAMSEETSRVTDELLWEGRGGISALWTHSATWATSGLAALYGQSVPNDGAFHRITLPAAQGRGGVLGLTAFLASQANDTEGSQILRGLMVRSRVLCDPPPPPPPAARETVVVSRLVTEPCATCHRRFEAIGMGLTAYDAVGRHVQSQSQVGSVLGGTDIDGEFQSLSGLGTRMANSGQVLSCMGTQWARMLSGSENPELASLLAESLSRTGGDVRELVVDYVTSAHFTHRTDEFGATCEATP